MTGWKVIDRSKDAKGRFAIEPQDAHDSCGFFALANGASFRPMSRADLDEVMVFGGASFAYAWS